MEYQERKAVPYNGNPFGLVYRDAITENRRGFVQIHPIEYDLNGIRIAANVYTPADYSAEGSYPAIVVAHPNGAVKEQAAGLYAEKLAEKGYITIAFDAAYSGESGGTPRNLDIPYCRIEDIRHACDILSGFEGTDENRISVLGICGGGGYALSAAEMDKRFRNAAVVSMFNSGAVRRNGFQNVQSDTVLARLHDIAAIRAKEVKEGNLIYNSDMSAMSAETAAKMPFEMYRQGYEYYVQTHAHPNSHSRFAQRNLMDLMVYDPDDFAHLIDQPLLMIIGSAADTNYMSEKTFSLAVNSADKKMVRIEGASHVDLYWVKEYVSQAIDAIDAFFRSHE